MELLSGRDTLKFARQHNIPRSGRVRRPSLMASVARRGYADNIVSRRGKDLLQLFGDDPSSSTIKMRLFATAGPYDAFCSRG